MLLLKAGAGETICKRLEGGETVFNASEQGISVRERALRRALKEALAQQKYSGIVPAAPDYETIARRAQAIEQAMLAKEHDART
jgi:hypothetical protein